MPAPLAFVVLKQSFLNQTAPMSDTVLYTPSDDGTFRLSGYLEVAHTGGSGAVTATFVWGDDFNPRSEIALFQPFLTVFFGSGAPFNGIVTTLRLKGGVPLSVSTSGNQIGRA